MSDPIITKGTVKQQAYTLEEYSKQISEITRYFAEAAGYNLIMRKNALADMLAMGYMPPTRWQRFKYRIEDIKQRFKDIWIIVSGGDVHKNCGY